MANILSSLPSNDYPHANDNFKRPTRNFGRATKRFCKRHKSFEPVNSRCFHKLKPSVAANGTYKPWVNRVLFDGEGVLIKSKKHHQELCRSKGFICPED